MLTITCLSSNSFYIDDSRVVVGHVGSDYVRVRVEADATERDRLTASLECFPVKTYTAESGVSRIWANANVNVQDGFLLGGARVTLAQCDRGAARFVIDAPRSVSIQRDKVRKRYGRDFSRSDG